MIKNYTHNLQICVLDFLKNVERKKNTEEISFDKLVMMSENIASGMSELVRLGVVHRDLAARNVMVDKWLQVKIDMRCMDKSNLIFLRIIHVTLI